MKKATTSNKTTAISTKQANKKIENAEQLTKEEVAQLQETAQDRQLAFCDSFKKATDKRKDITVTKVSSKNNITVKTANKTVAEICRKENYTVIYTVRCTDTKERDKLLKSYKDSEAIHTCKTKKYLDSKETRLELIIENNKVDKSFIDLIVTTCDSLKEARQQLKKAK